MNEHSLLPNYSILFKNRLYFWIALPFLLQIAIIVLLIFQKYIPALIIISLLFFVPFTLFSMERTYYLLAAYVAIFPQMATLYNFPGLPIFYTEKIGVPIFILFLFYWVTYLMIKSEKIEISAFDKAMFFFFISFLISGGVGFFKGYPIKYWIYNFVPLAYYSAYFPFVHSKLRNSPVLRFFDFIVLFMVIHSFLSIYSVLARKIFFTFHRVFTEEVNLTVMAVPYIGLTLIYPSSRARKILFSLALLPLTISILVSLQRSLWGVMILYVLFFIALLIIKNREFIKKHFFTFFLIFISVILLIFSGLFIMERVTPGEFFKTIQERASLIFNIGSLPTDISWLTRWGEIRDALSKMGENDIFFGMGLGVRTFSRFRFFIQQVIDNSFAYLYWKMGIMGVITYVSVLLIFFHRCISLLRKTKETEIRVFVLSSVFYFTGIFIIGIFNSILFSYRFTLLWGANFGMIENLYRKWAKKEF